jgi:hypothetical protein
MKREWTVYITPEDEFDNGLASVEASVHDLTTCLLRLGGVGAISPIRRGIRGPDGHVEYENVGVHFKYDSYAPGINPDPEVEEAGVPVDPIEEVEEPTPARQGLAVVASVASDEDGGEE